MTETPAETFPFSEHGYTCFHCGDTFTTFGAARDHFGFDPSWDPACRIKIGEERGLVMELRKVQLKYIELLERQLEEDTGMVREIYSLGTEHRRAVVDAEQRGYERGLADGSELKALAPLPEDIATAVAADLRDGMSLRATAAKYRISFGKVRGVAKTLRASAPPREPLLAAGLA